MPYLDPSSGKTLYTAEEASAAVAKPGTDAAAQAVRAAYALQTPEQTAYVAQQVEASRVASLTPEQRQAEELLPQIEALRASPALHGETTWAKYVDLVSRYDALVAGDQSYLITQAVQGSGITHADVVRAATGGSATKTEREMVSAAGYSPTNMPSGGKLVSSMIDTEAIQRGISDQTSLSQTQLGFGGPGFQHTEAYIAANLPIGTVSEKSGTTWTGTGWVNIESPEKAALRPDIYSITDPKQLALMQSEGLTGYQAASRLLAVAQTPKDVRYYETLLTQTWTTETGKSAAYHAWAKDTGLPQLANPYEYTADLLTYAMKGYPTREAERFSPIDYTVLGLPSGKGQQEYAWGTTAYDVTKAMDVVAAVQRSGEMGPYGELKAWSSKYGELPIGQQQDIAKAAARTAGWEYTESVWSEPKGWSEATRTRVVDMPSRFASSKYDVVQTTTLPTEADMREYQQAVYGGYSGGILGYAAFGERAPKVISGAAGSIADVFTSAFGFLPFTPFADTMRKTDVGYSEYMSTLSARESTVKGLEQKGISTYGLTPEGKIAIDTSNKQALDFQNQYETAQKEYSQTLATGVERGYLKNSGGKLVTTPEEYAFQYGEYSKWGAGAGKTLQETFGISKEALDTTGVLLESLKGPQATPLRLGYGAEYTVLTRPEKIVTAAGAGVALGGIGEVAGMIVSTPTVATRSAALATQFPTAARVAPLVVPTALTGAGAYSVTEGFTATMEHTQINIGKIAPELGAMGLGATVGYGALSKVIGASNIGIRITEVPTPEYAFAPGKTLRERVEGFPSEVSSAVSSMRYKYIEWKTPGTAMGTPTTSERFATEGRYTRPGATFTGGIRRVNAFLEENKARTEFYMGRLRSHPSSQLSPQDPMHKIMGPNPEERGGISIVSLGGITSDIKGYMIGQSPFTQMRDIFAKGKVSATEIVAQYKPPLQKSEPYKGIETKTPTGVLVSKAEVVSLEQKAGVESTATPLLGLRTRGRYVMEEEPQYYREVPGMKRPAPQESTLALSREGLQITGVETLPVPQVSLSSTMAIRSAIRNIVPQTMLGTGSLIGLGLASLQSPVLKSDQSLGSEQIFRTLQVVEPRQATEQTRALSSLTAVKPIQITSIQPREIERVTTREIVPTLITPITPTELPTIKPRPPFTPIIGFPPLYSGTAGGFGGGKRMRPFTEIFRMGLDISSRQAAQFGAPKGSMPTIAGLPGVAKNFMRYRRK